MTLTAREASEPKPEGRRYMIVVIDPFGKKLTLHFDTEDEFRSASYDLSCAIETNRPFHFCGRVSDMKFADVTFNPAHIATYRRMILNADGSEVRER